MAKAEFEYKCRKCGKVFVGMDQGLTDEKDIVAVKHLREIISAPAVSSTHLLAIHACAPPDDGTLSLEMGVADLIGYVVRTKNTLGKLGEA